MYEFIDTTNHSESTPYLPIEAVSINGFGEESNYIEELISGYRTLYTSGREALPLNLATSAVGSADGETIIYANYPSRIITIGFELKAETPQEFREKFNHLNNILSADEADFVFRDEPGVYFTGTPIADITVETGTNTVRGEWQIYCAYPFKRSVAVFEAEPVYEANNASAAFNINYGGTYPGKPVLVAQFAGAKSGGNYSEDGDCGFVAFADEGDNIIQLGNPDAIDVDEFNRATTLINREFTTISSWATSGGKTYHGNRVIDGSIAATNIVDTYWSKGKGQTRKFAKPSYGSNTTAWHGPIMYAHTAGALNFDIALVHRICCNNSKEVGSFECGAYNVEGSVRKLVAGIVIEKTSSGASGVVKYIVNGVAVGSNTIDLSYYNTNFGYCKRTPIYKTQYYNKKTKKWSDTIAKKKKNRGGTRQVVSTYTYTQSNLNTKIKKVGSKVTFKVGNLSERTFVDSDIDMIPAHDISFHFAKNKGMSALHTNAVASVKFTSSPSGAYKDVSNVFTAGDVVEADTFDASVYLKREGTEEGNLTPQLGALGNDWEEFSLQKGANTIVATWSDWVNEEYKPTLKILYNEVYL